MIRLAAALPRTAGGCWRQTRALLRSGARLTEAPPVHRHIRCARPLLPLPTVAVRCSPPFAFDTVSPSVPATSRLRPFDCRTPHGLTRSLRIPLPDDPLRLGSDRLDVVVPFA